MEVMELGWKYIDEFEFVAVTGCFLRLTQSRISTLWYTMSAPIPTTVPLKVGARALGWAALLSLYLMFRVEALAIAGFIDWPAAFLVVIVTVLMLAVIASTILINTETLARYAGEGYGLFKRQSPVLAKVLIASMFAAYSTMMISFMTGKKYAVRFSPLVRKWGGSLGDRIRMLFWAFAQK